MNRGVPLRATVTWTALMIATAVTWWLGADPAANGGGKMLVAMAIPVAFLKVYLIGTEFMEVRMAPPVLRAVFGGWTALLTVALTLIYLV